MMSGDHTYTGEKLLFVCDHRSQSVEHAIGCVVGLFGVDNQRTLTSAHRRQQLSAYYFHRRRTLSIDGVTSVVRHDARLRANSSSAWSMCILATGYAQRRTVPPVR
jgi:hypothetical protein